MMGFIATITPNPLLGEVSCFINSCLVSVLGSQQSGRRRKHAKANIWTALLDNYLFLSLCSPPSVHVNQYAAWYTPIVNLIQAS